MAKLNKKTDELSEPQEKFNKERENSGRSYKGSVDSESNLTLASEYDTIIPKFSHFEKQKAEENGKNSRKNSDLKLEKLRYSCEDDNLNSPISKSQKF